MSVDKFEVCTSPTPSDKLKLMLEEANQAFGHAKEAVLSAYRQALSERFSPSQAKELLLSSLKMVSKRTIYLYLPDEAKDKKMQSLARGSLQNCSDKKEKYENPFQVIRDRDRQVDTSKIKYHYPGTVILSSDMANCIHDKVHVEKSSFILTHDGRNVTCVEVFVTEKTSKIGNLTSHISNGAESNV